MDTKHECHQCGAEWKERHKPGRRDVCSQCAADLRVCLNCRHYESRYVQGCAETRADPVRDKTAANFCDYFQFALKVPENKQAEGSDQEEAIDRLKRLLEDS